MQCAPAKTVLHPAGTHCTHATASFRTAGTLCTPATVTRRLAGTPCNPATASFRTAGTPCSPATVTLRLAGTHRNPATVSRHTAGTLCSRLIFYGATPRLRRIPFPGEGKHTASCCGIIPLPKGRKIEYNAQNFSEFGEFLRKKYDFFAKKLPQRYRAKYSSPKPKMTSSARTETT